MSPPQPRPHHFLGARDVAVVRPWIAAQNLLQLHDDDKEWEHS